MSVPAHQHGRPVGPYLVGSFLGAVVSGLIPVLLARHLRRGQRRFRGWTMAVVVISALFCLVAARSTATAVSRVGGLSGLVVCAVLVVLLFRPASNRWFARR